MTNLFHTLAEACSHGAEDHNTPSGPVQPFHQSRFRFLRNICISLTSASMFHCHRGLTDLKR
jgi:hypothetical protein